MNTGKLFERDFKASVPKEYYFLRLHDPAVGFTGGASSFAVSNPFDCLLYTGKVLYCLELKSKDGAITYWREDFETDGKKHTFEIKKHQILGLQRAAGYEGVFAALVINFRNKEETWCIPIRNFLDYTNELRKKSINAEDAALMDGILIPEKKLKVNRRYDIRALTEVIEHGR